MESLTLELQQELKIFRRQYLQLQVKITYPAPDSLRQEVFQQTLYDRVFAEGAVEHHPPERYQLKVLKELMRRIESSITNWDEEVCTFPIVFTIRR
jgi:hypothetical protein